MLGEYWDKISRTIGLSEEFIMGNYHIMLGEYWDKISRTIGLSEEFIMGNYHKLNWVLISRCQKLSEDFIRNNSDRVIWTNISKYQKLSEDFMKEFSDKVNWKYISRDQKLSEEFISEFRDKVYWPYIEEYQKLSEGFIRENSNKLYFPNIAKYQKLSSGFIKEYNLDIPETNWLYKDKEFKREYIKANTEYEIIGNKVIAYKSCREDGYSIYSFQYYYEVGGEYESHADYNIDNDNSFGLSAWTKDRALEYHSTGKLFKVEIDLEDLAVIVYGGDKIRASRIKILEEIN